MHAERIVWIVSKLLRENNCLNKLQHGIISLNLIEAFGEITAYKSTRCHQYTNYLWVCTR